MSNAPCLTVAVRLELWRGEAGQGKEVGVLQLLVGRQVGRAVKQGSHVRGLPGSKRVNRVHIQGKKVPESGDRK